MESTQKRDITGRADIETLVNSFYHTVLNDALLGFIFTDIARTQWDEHLPKMYAFWETVLFRSGGYKGNPLSAHMQLTPLTTMGREQFDRWLCIFKSTVDSHFIGENAEHIKHCAADMANVIHSKINTIQK